MRILLLGLGMMLVMSCFVSAAMAATSPKETVFEAVDRNKDEIAKVGDAIYSFAELGMQEFETSKLCVDVLKKMGFNVKTGISGFPTAIMATYGSGKPVIAVHVEYDAVPSGSQQAGALERKEVVSGAI